jgi:DNA mismatch repair protein MutS
MEVLQPQEILSRESGVPAELCRWIEARDICHTTEREDVWPDGKRAQQIVQRQLGTTTLKGFGLETREPAVQATAAALQYARDTHRSDLSHVRALRVGEARQNMILDAITITNLEVFRSLRDGRRKGSLLWVMDRTVTAPGGRLLKEWMQRPLRDADLIEARQEGVQEILESSRKRARLADLLSQVGDPERIVARAVLGMLHPREAAALRDGLSQVPSILNELREAAAPVLREISRADPLAELAASLESSLEPDPAASLKHGGVIRAGVDEELDRQRSLAKDSRRHVLELESRERERTGISSLKIRFNKVFGYYLEVTRANQHLVPDDYIRKQTLVNSERYITAELKELEEQILAAEESQVALELQHFEMLQGRVARAATEVRDLARALATLDVLVGFAEVAARSRFTRPRVTAPGAPISIREGRHPVVEKMSSEPFVPNDSDLDTNEAQIVILTGPNMGGKSTYLRQTALIVLMAQVGCFVPAEEARLGIVDRIFTRVGASDDLSRGESTFMVEMIETAKILHQCSAESLVILDEVGRGTATFDGLSLAWAIVEHLHEHGRPMTLFATHYHELTELSALLPRVVNRTLSVKEWEDQIVFLRRVVPGSSDKSYGLHVARLAGIPEPVIRRASEILGNLEAQEYDLAGKPRLARGTASVGGSGPDQLALFAPAEEVAVSILREIDTESLTPMAALNLLHALRDRIGGD